MESGISHSIVLSSTEEALIDPSDTELIAKARKGDHMAFRRLVERYEHVVASTVTGMLGAGADADDVGQETFVRFYRALEQFRGESTVGTYLTRIAMNLSLNALKRRSRWYSRFLKLETAEQAPESEPLAEERLSSEEQTRRIREAIESLRPEFRAVVVLRLIDGYSTKETAEILGLPLGTVLSRLARAQSKLRKRLEPYLSELL